MNTNKIVNAFLQPEFYDHPVHHIEFVETHISWVFLTGYFAYKVKKPVDFGFLNFTRLEQRKYYCHKELELNRRFAPEIYLEVVPIVELENSQPDKKLSLSGQGKIVDYAIKMRQFDQNGLLDQLLKKHKINLCHIDKLADIVADFHNKINIAGSNVSFGSEVEVIQPVEENFLLLTDILANKKEQQSLKALHEKMRFMYDLIRPQFAMRKKRGHIRECHGDLHLGNITLSENRIVLFDGIEFNDSLRWIDTISDCAFLIMDLDDHEQTLFANHFLNAYLLKSGDYSSLPLLHFYKFYRAMVRAKVAGLKLQQEKINSAAYKNIFNDLRSYLELAERYASTAISKNAPKNKLFLAISYGLSGSGKSWASTQIADRLGAIRINSDTERKRLFSNIIKNFYSDYVVHHTYTHLIVLCELILNAGFSVIVDATFLDKKWRHEFQLIAGKYQVDFHILSCYAKQDIIKQRLKSRELETNNASDAGVSVMENQLKNSDRLNINEQKYEIAIDTVRPLDWPVIIVKLQKK